MSELSVMSVGIAQSHGCSDIIMSKSYKFINCRKYLQTIALQAIILFENVQICMTLYKHEGSYIFYILSFRHSYLYVY